MHTGARGIHYLVVKGQHKSFVHIQFDCNLWLAGAHITVGTGWVQSTWNKQLFPGVRLLVQEDLRRPYRKEHWKMFQSTVGIHQTLNLLNYLQPSWLQLVNEMLGQVSDMLNFDVIMLKIVPHSYGQSFPECAD